MFSTWRSVLLVEDEPLLRELAEQALARANHRVVAVATVDQARDAMAAEVFDVLLTDYSLAGGVTGIELAHEMQAAAPGLSVVVMTGYDVETLRDDCGVVLDKMCFLQKPFRLDALVEMVEQSPIRVRGADRGTTPSPHRAGSLEGSPGVMA